MQKVIVIVCGGFSGAYCAKYLERWLPKDWELILFSQENYLTFTPLLAEVVGASIAPIHVVRPIRQMLRRTDCRTANVTRLDLAANDPARPVGLLTQFEVILQYTRSQGEGSTEPA